MYGFGRFRVLYDSDITVYSEAPVIRLRLHVNEKATMGKTTVCITYLEWQASDSAGKYEVEHRIPSSINISKSEAAIVPGDVNLDDEITLLDVKYIMQYCNGTKP